jgi:hypothetical protein
MNAEQDQVTQLGLDWPAWQIWVVYRYQGGPVFCARRRDDEKQVLNAGSRNELTGLLVEATTAAGEGFLP